MSAVDRSRLPGLGPDPRFTFPAIEKSSLSNGLRVWTVEHRELPVVTFLLLIHRGSAADPHGRSGLASLTGDMLDEGSGDRSAIDLHEALARIGAEFDTEVGVDATTLTLTTLARFQDRALRLLADMVVRPRLAPEDFARVRQLRTNRLTQLRDLPPAVAERAFTQVLYGDHPYGHLPIGTESALTAMSLDDVAGFHRRIYGPSQATFIAVGDGSHEELRSACLDAFGEWSDGAPRSIGDDLAGTVVPPPSSPSRLAIVHRPGASQSELRIGQVAASRETPDYHALLVLNTILGGQFVSRINLNLREDKGYTYGARTAFEFRRGRGPFVLQVSVQTSATSDAVRESLAELEAIRRSRPASARELELARAAITRGYPRNFETAAQMARAAAQMALHDLPDDYFEQFVSRVAAVEADEVTRVASAYLDPSRMTTVVVGDRDLVAAPLEGLALGEPALVAP